MILLIALCAFLSVSLFAIGVARSISAPRARLRERIEQIARGEMNAADDFRGRRLLRMQNYSSLPVLRDMLQHSMRAERIADELDRAAIPLRVGEYLLIRVGAGLIFTLWARILMPAGGVRIAAMLMFFLVGMIAPRLVLKSRLKRRRAAVEASLPDALDMIARSLRAGSGLLTAIEIVVEQIGGALSDEFGRLRREIAAGLGTEEAFRELGRRVGSKDLDIVITAILIQREVGGNLAEILGNVAGTMRERTVIRNEMNSMTSRQRLSAYLIAAVPVAVLIGMTIMLPDATRPLFERQGGRMLLAVAGGLELLGFLTIRHLSSSFEV